MKNLVVLAGANGSGKSSAVESIYKLMEQIGERHLLYLCSDDVCKQILLKDPTIPLPEAQVKAWQFVNGKKYDLLDSKESFIIETVFSHPSHLDFIKKAKECGYTVFFYYISTDSPDINVQRVRKRISQGGHAVDEDKIVSRYYRSLKLVKPALSLVDEAYIIDNSIDDSDTTLCAVYKAGHLEILDKLHRWVLDSLK